MSKHKSVVPADVNSLGFISRARRLGGPWSRSSLILIVAFSFGLIGLLLLLSTFAANGVVQIEAEKTGNSVKKIADAGASKGSYIEFGTGVGGGEPLAHLSLIMNQSTRNKQFIANRTGIDGNGFWKNTYDETIVPESQIKTTDFLGPASEHYESEAQSNGKFGHFGLFRTECEFSHFAYDDPIVAPGKVGAAHLHMFFGNTNTNAYTNDRPGDPNYIRDTGSGSCNGGPLNRTAYWVPAMINQDGKIETPDRITIYYKNISGPGRQKVSPYPHGLKIISGNAKTDVEQKQMVSSSIYALVGYEGCGYDADARVEQQTGVLPRCPTPSNSDHAPNGLLKMVIRFPFCWDGKNLDSSDHNSHMSFPVGGVFGEKCPGSHPIMFPSIEYRIDYEYSPGDDTSKWFLSSDVRPDGNGGYVMAPGGNGSTMHGDWYSGWNDSILNQWVTNCSNNVSPQGGNCGSGKLSMFGDIALKRLRSINDRNAGLGFYDNPDMEPSELVKLCPGKTLTSDIKSVALCN